MSRPHRSPSLRFITYQGAPTLSQPQPHPPGSRIVGKGSYTLTHLGVSLALVGRAERHPRPLSQMSSNIGERITSDRIGYSRSGHRWSEGWRHQPSVHPRLVRATGFTQCARRRSYLSREDTCGGGWMRPACSPTRRVGLVVQPVCRAGSDPIAIAKARIGGAAQIPRRAVHRPAGSGAASEISGAVRRAAGELGIGSCGSRGGDQEHNDQQARSYHASYRHGSCGGR